MLSPPRKRISISETKISKRNLLSYSLLIFKYVFRLLRDAGFTRFADRFDKLLNNALDLIPSEHISVEGCQEVWLANEDRTAWDPATATKCQYARKVARSYRRWAENNLCLDTLPRGGTSLTNKLGRKFDIVIDFMWNSKFCVDESP